MTIFPDTPDALAHKESLIQFLRTKPEFDDYDFTNTTTDGLLDLLAQNSYINAFYLHMALQESFITTAIKRDSVVQKAQNVGYIPTSSTCARGYVTLEITPINNNISSITVPRGTIFTSTFDDGNFLFRTKESININIDINGQFIANGVELIEGKYLTHEFKITENNQKLQIPNQNVDTELLEVCVKEQASSDFNIYAKADGIVGINSSSKIYFIEEDYGALHNVYMGDGILGKALTIGDTVKISYFISSGKSPNGIGSFTLKSSIDNAAEVNIIATSAVSGGSEIESIKSIKFNAPLSFSKQNRLVTPSDYTQEIKSIYPNALDVISYGGETVNPPRYGVVLIAIRPNNGFILTDTEKLNLQNKLKLKNISAIKPVIVDPEYTFVNINATVYYNISGSNYNLSDLKANISSNIEKYGNDNLNLFLTTNSSKGLRRSILSRYIDNTDSSVINNNIDYVLSKRFFLSLNKSISIDIDFGTSIEKGSISTSKFSMYGLSDCYYIESTSLSNTLNIVRVDETGKTVNVVSNAASIDYDLGLITTQILSYDSFEESPNFYDSLSQRYFFEVKGTPSKEDIIPQLNSILTINDINIDMVSN